MAYKKPEITNKIVGHIGKINLKQTKTVTLELNLVSWNNGEGKYDIRDWSEDHSFFKGIPH